MDKKIQSRAAKLAGLSLAALLSSASIAAADEAATVNIGGTKISLYGRLELNSSYDDGKTTAPWSSMAVPDAEKGEGRVYLGVGRTRLGFNLEGPQKEGEPKAFGRFETDFANDPAASTSNGANGFRIRQSYGGVKFENIGLTVLFGQTDDVITPLDPPSVNPTSLNGVGNLGTRRPQIRVTEALGPMELAVAATHDRGAANPTMPGVQGRLGFKMPAGWAGEKANLALGVSGHFAKEENAEAKDAAKESDVKFEKGPSSHSFGADLSIPVISILTLTGEFFMGQDLRNYANASLNMRPSDMVDDNPNDVAKNGIGSMGWWAAMALKLPANLSAASGVGMESIDDDSRIVGKQENNMFVFANLAYNFTSVTKLTFEYMRLTTDYTGSISDNGKSFKDDGVNGSLNRFELNFRYDFK